jgi:hypothetical protein
MYASAEQSDSHKQRAALVMHAGGPSSQAAYVVATHSVKSIARADELAVDPLARACSSHPVFAPSLRTQFNVKAPLPAAMHASARYSDAKVSVSPQQDGLFERQGPAMVDTLPSSPLPLQRSSTPRLHAISASHHENSRMQCLDTMTVTGDLVSA